MMQAKSVGMKMGVTDFLPLIITAFVVAISPDAL